MQRFSVRKMAPEMVSPSESTPSGYLPLSESDRKYAQGIFIEIYLMYGGGGNGEINPVTVIKKALADALVHYYPVAGRLVVNDDGGKLQVDCTGEGVWFVEASAECHVLQDLDYILAQPRLIPREELMPAPPPEVDQAQHSFMMQVTTFKCGGFLVGVRYNRNMFDVLGGGQFIVAISEMARGLPQPKINPIWCRELFPNRAQLPLPTTPPPPLPSFKFEFVVLDVPLDPINQMKNDFVKETGEGCTVFDIICAKLWQSRTRAIDLQPDDEEVTFFFPVSVRDLMRPREVFSKGGFYGNCVHFTTVKSTSGQIANGPFAETVKLFKDGKARLAGEFEAYLKGEQESDPLGIGNTYGAMGITYFRRLGYYEPDFGWGPPDAICPSVEQVPDFVAGCTVLNVPAPKTGIRLLTHCVVEEHLDAFRKEIEKWG